MHDDFADIENALRRLKPRSPSEFCQARIAAVLDVPAATARGSRILIWSAGFAAACVAIVALIPETFQNGADAALTGATAPLAATAPTISVEPENTPQVRRALSSIEPLELRQAPDGRFFQPYRVRYLDTVETRAPGTSAPRISSVPDEEVHFVGLDLI